MQTAAVSSIKELLVTIQRDVLVPIWQFLFVLATVIFLWGIIQYVIGSKGDEKKLEKGKQIMLWGIVGMVIMAAAWGIVSLICGTVGACNQGPPTVVPHPTLPPGYIPNI